MFEITWVHLVIFGAIIIVLNTVIDRAFWRRRYKPYVEMLDILAGAKDWSKLDADHLARVYKGFKDEFLELAEPRYHERTTRREEVYQNQHQRLCELLAALAMCAGETARKEAVVQAKELYEEMLDADYDPNMLHFHGQQLERLLSQRFAASGGQSPSFLPFISLTELGHHHNRFGAFYTECVKGMLKKEPISGGISAST